MKKMIIIWSILAVSLVGTLTFIGFRFQNSIKEYKTLENDMKESAGIYMEINEVPLDVNDTLKITSDQLIEAKTIASMDIYEDACKGYVLVTKKRKGYEYQPYIKCKNYTTLDY